MLRVFEPRYLALFRDQLPPGAADSPEQLAAARRRVRFGHVLAPEAAPPALLEEGGAVGGLPRVGVYARVDRVEERPDGTLAVHYEGVRRFALLAVDRDAAPYPLAAVQWYDDALASLPASERGAVDALEREVMALLTQAARLAGRVGGGSGSSSGSANAAAAAQQQQLPAAVLRYKPPPPPPASGGASTAEYLRAAGVPAGEAIATWQRHGSVYGSRAAPKAAAADPYQALREAVGKDRRQELFSFAAAGCLELGAAERLALLLSRDTAARLAYVAAAARPHVADLAARAAVRGALGGSGS